jgi:hypothetical protein
MIRRCPVPLLAALVLLPVTWTVIAAQSAGTRTHAAAV